MPHPSSCVNCLRGSPAQPLGSALWLCPLAPPLGSALRLCPPAPPSGFAPWQLLGPTQVRQPHISTCKVQSTTTGNNPPTAVLHPVIKLWRRVSGSLSSVPPQACFPTSIGKRTDHQTLATHEAVEESVWPHIRLRPLAGGDAHLQTHLYTTHHARD